MIRFGCLSMDFSIVSKASCWGTPTFFTIITILSNMLFCCFKLQIAQDTAAVLTVSQDKLFSNQYLRVTLKSVYAITGFIVKAVDHTNEDNKGNIYIKYYQYKKLLSALGTWYLPYLAPTTTISSSSYRNCSGHHNAVTHSGLLQDIYVVFFQWMPDVEHE